MSIKIKQSTDIRPECNFCFDNKSKIFEIKGDGFIVISICEKCLNQINEEKLKIVDELDEYRKNIRSLADNKSDIPFTQS